jgi:death-on-curing protein
VRTLGGDPAVRDHGLLAAALARPWASMLGEDAYRGLHGKAAALLHSLTRNHVLIDGDKRLAMRGAAATMPGRRHRVSGAGAFLPGNGGRRSCPARA